MDIQVIKKRLKADMMQIFVVQLLFSIFWTTALISSYTDKSKIVFVVIMSILIYLALIVEGYICFFRNKKKIEFCISDYYYLMPIMILALVAFLSVRNAWLNMDGYIYYADLRRVKQWDFTNIFSLGMAGHCTQGYSILLLIGEYLFPNDVLGIRLINFLMYLVTIGVFGNIVEKICINCSSLKKSLYVACFAFAPIFMGLIPELNTDFPLLCFLVWLVYSTMEEKIVFQMACGFLLCFSKETGVFLYGFFWMGVVLKRSVEKIKDGWKPFLKNLFLPSFVINYIPAIIWLIYFIAHIRQGWLTNIGTSSSGGITSEIAQRYDINSFAVWPQYIFMKITQLLFCNFNWLFYIIILFGILSSVFEKKILVSKIKIKSEIACGFLCSFLGFVIYTFVYVTYNQYRYILPFTFFVTILYVWAIENVDVSEKVKKIISGIIVCALLVSNFYTFDPLSKMEFAKQGTGTGDILMVSNIISDSNQKAIMYDKDDIKTHGILNGVALYNLQGLQLSVAFDKMLDEIEYDNKTLVIVPTQYREPLGTIANIYGINAFPGIDEYYWDSDKKMTCVSAADMYLNTKDSRYQKVNIVAYNNIYDLDKATRNRYSRIYYVELPFMPEYNHNAFLSDGKVIDRKMIQYMSWKFVVDKIK